MVYRYVPDFTFFFSSVVERFTFFAVGTDSFSSDSFEDEEGEAEEETEDDDADACADSVLEDVFAFTSPV